jgi:hypothetical protein
LQLLVAAQVVRELQELAGVAVAVLQESNLDLLL